MIRHFISLLLFLFFPLEASAERPWDHGHLKVSENGRYFQQADGKPFFWLADTGWLVAQKLTREDIETYFADREAKGFNVVQTVVFQMLDDKNVYGDTAALDKDIGRLNITQGADPKVADEYDYWDHVDYMIDTAARHGIYVALAPVWSHTVRRAPISSAQVGPYVAYLADRWKNKPNIIWLNGGSAKGNENTEVWETIGATIKRAAPQQLITFHPFGRMQSSSWFHTAPWLDFNMFVSGHRRYDQDIDGKKYGEDNWRYTLDDRSLVPPKPTLDGEPAYENTPQGLHSANEPYWTGADVRRYAYWSVFAGAAGHTYGENSVRQVYLPGEVKPASGAIGFFKDRLDAPGAVAMHHLKNLILSRPYFDRISDQMAVGSEQGAAYERILVTKGADFLMVYTYSGRAFALSMGRISGEKVRAWWFNPRTGDVVQIGVMANQGRREFNPPGGNSQGKDWVLVLDDISKGFGVPGATR